jgi:hypothetical protein
LIHLLQNAHAGERAAAFAYQGHSLSVSSPIEKADIAQIEADEWRHRDELGHMLSELGGRPRWLREVWMMCVGTFISLFCRVGGWFIPMYGAGKLERGNIEEYEIAARLALDCGLSQYVECLLDMAEVEWDHELYFRSKAASHRLWRLLPGWSAPPPRTAIRDSFREYQSRGASAPALATLAT